MGAEVAAGPTPAQSLQPDKEVTPWSRWKLVLHELLGQGRGRRQLAGIMVSHVWGQLSRVWTCSWDMCMGLFAGSWDWDCNHLSQCWHTAPDST